MNDNRSTGPDGQRIDRRTRTVHGRRAADAVPPGLWRGAAWAIAIEAAVVLAVVAWWLS